MENHLLDSYLFLKHKIMLIFVKLKDNHNLNPKTKSSLCWLKEATVNLHKKYSMHKNLVLIML